MELENSDEALFNSSTEFLITFDSAEDTKQGMPVHRCEDSSAGTGEKVAGDGTSSANGQPVKTADSEHIMCEFSAGDTGWFTSQNTGAGESVTADDVWLSLSCDSPGIYADTFESPLTSVFTTDKETSELYADRKSDYIKHSVDISSDFTVANDNATSATNDRKSDYIKNSVDLSSDFTIANDSATSATNVTLLELGDMSCKSEIDGDQNQTAQIPALFPPADQQLTSEHNSIKQGSDIFSDFTAINDIAAENTNKTRTQMVDTDCMTLGDGDKHCSVQLAEQFPHSDEFSQQLNDGEHLPVFVFPTAQIFDQQPVETNNEVSLEKHEINTSLPDVHKAVIKQELISEFPDHLFSEEGSRAPEITAERSELSQPIVDVVDAVAIEEIQVLFLELIFHMLH